jgi:hypothetical protein
VDIDVMTERPPGVLATIVNFLKDRFG